MTKINTAGLSEFVKREGFYKLVLLNKPSNLIFPQTELPLAVYVPYRAGKPPTECKEWLKSQGFERLTTLERYICRGDRSLGSSADNTELPTNAITTATADETYAFLRQYFTWEEMDLPPRETFEPNDTFCARTNDGSLLGIVYNMGHTRIVATAPEARGQGICGKLYRAFMEPAAQNGKAPTFYEWIKPDNFSSIAMFKKLGFEKDSLVTDCWVRR